MRPEYHVSWWQRWGRGPNLWEKKDFLTAEQVYFKKVTNGCTYSHKDITGALLWGLLVAFGWAQYSGWSRCAWSLLLLFARSVCVNPIRILYMVSLPLTLCIRTSEFLDLDAYFPMHTLFETDKIREEVKRYVSEHNMTPTHKTFSGENAYIGSGGSTTSMWRLKVVKVLSSYDSDAHRELPELVRALRTCESQVVSCAISKLEPGVKIPMHVGYYKGVLRYMVGISIPQKRDHVWLNVNGIVKHWSEGEGFIWDDTYPHAVYNNTSETRIVLYMDIARTHMHPLLMRLNSAMLCITKLSGIADAEIRKTEQTQRI